MLVRQRDQVKRNLFVFESTFLHASGAERSPFSAVLLLVDTVTLKLGEGEVLLERLIENGVGIAHDCGGTLACASCRVVVCEGAQTLSAPSEDELDMLERAGASGPGARLACQTAGSGAEVTVELPQHEAPRHGELLPLAVTAQAASHLAAQLAKHPGALGVRLGVEPAGCSGLRYRVDPASAIRDGDVVFESSGIRIVVDAASLPHVQGTTIDVVQEGLARRMRFDNPNVRQSCGCGESFGT
jgi:iron-sulfur cluster assembly protein